MEPFKDYPDECAKIIEVCRRLHSRNMLAAAGKRAKPREEIEAYAAIRHDRLIGRREALLDDGERREDVMSHRRTAPRIPVVAELE